MNTNRDDLNDDLSALFGGAPVTPRVLPQAERLVAAREAATQSFAENCRKCGGSGNWRPGFPCFACKGKGKLTFKTSPEARATGRAKAAERRERDAQELQAQIAAWGAEHKAERDWLARAVAWNVKTFGTPEGKFDFPAKMVETIGKFGSLTDNQLAAVRKLMLRDEAKRAEREAAKPAVDASKIEAAFATARANAARPGMVGVWTRPLPMTSTNGQTVVFQAGRNKWEGTIFVQAHGTEKQLGMIRGGKFSPKFGCSDAEQAAVLDCASDPHNAAKAFGKAFGVCCVCSRTLTNDGSIEAGIGPICAEKFGW